MMQVHELLDQRLATGIRAINALLMYVAAMAIFAFMAGVDLYVCKALIHAGLNPHIVTGIGIIVGLYFAWATVMKLPEQEIPINGRKYTSFPFFVVSLVVVSYFVSHDIIPPHEPPRHISFAI